jgi:O-antigen ligase
MSWLPLLTIDIQRWIPKGNEWISLSVLQVMLTVATLRLFPLASRWRLSLCLLASGAIAINLLIMNQRIAVLVLVIGLVCLALAWWRAQIRKMTLLAAFISIALLSVIVSVDKVSDKFQRGWTEIEQARSGLVNRDSMNIRYHMYTKTTDMMLERPLTGWGIGSWNSEWKKRIDPILHPSNMPHNDFLWMGAQAGLPGAMAWLALMVSLIWMGWKQHSPSGHLAFSVSAIVLVNSLVNSGTRDANLGLPTLFLAAACLAWAFRQDQQSPADE